MRDITGKGAVLTSQEKLNTRVGSGHAPAYELGDVILRGLFQRLLACVQGLR